MIDIKADVEPSALVHQAISLYLEEETTLFVIFPIGGQGIILEKVAWDMRWEGPVASFHGCTDID